MTSFRSVFVSLGITTLLLACAETAYEPCDGKQAGDRCRLCAPDDPNCVETMILKTCSADGRCGARREDAGVPPDSSTASPIE
jgi:hypothetical protein